MNIPFLIIYHPLVTAAGLSSCYALYVLQICSAGALLYFTFRKNTSNQSTDTNPLSMNILFLVSQVFLLVITCFLMLTFFDSSEIIRTSYGQPFTLDNQKCNIS